MKGVNHWDRKKDGMPPVLTNDPKKHPIDLNAEGKKGSKMQRNKIGQVINR